MPSEFPIMFTLGSGPWSLTRCLAEAPLAIITGSRFHRVPALHIWIWVIFWYFYLQILWSSVRLDGILTGLPDMFDCIPINLMLPKSIHTLVPKPVFARGLLKVLSCWKVNLWHSLKSWALWSDFDEVYFSTLTSLSIAAGEKHHPSMTPPLPCFTAGMTADDGWLVPYCIRIYCLFQAALQQYVIKVKRSENLPNELEHEWAMRLHEPKLKSWQ